MEQPLGPPTSSCSADGRPVSSICSPQPSPSTTPQSFCTTTPDFEHIAAVTGQEQRWVVPRGTVA